MTEQVLLFEFSERLLALRVQVVQEVLRNVALTPPLDSSGRIEGFLNLRGRIVPVLDLARALGLEQVPVRAEQALIVVEQEVGEQGKECWAVRVDQVTTIHELEPTLIQPSTRYKQAPESFQVQAQVVFLLDPLRLSEWKETAAPGPLNSKGLSDETA